MRCKRLMVLAVIGAMTTAAACGGGDGDATGSGGGGGTFTVVQDRLDNTAPPNPFAPSGNSFAGYTSMQLAWPKNDLTDPNKFYPALAEDWDIRKNGNELTVHLRPDAKWSDGKPVTAQDVELSVQIAYTRGTGAFALTPGAAGAAREVEVLDDKTIRFTQDPENPANTFVRGVFDEMPIVPKHVYGELIPKDFDQTLETAKGDDAAGEKAREQIGEVAEKVTTFDPGEDISAGPFVLERQNPGEALLVKNEEFYAADKVAPDNVVVRNYSGNEQIWQYLQSGELDAAPFTAVPSNVLKQIEQVQGNVVSRSFSPVVAGLAFNQTKAPYDDLRVRRALAYLIDREQVAKVASPEGGLASKTTTGIHQEAAEAWFGGELDGLDPYQRDEKKATKQLEDAGFTKQGGTWKLPNGKDWKVTIQVVNGFSDWISAGQNIAAQLQEFGIQAETDTSPDFTVYQDEMAQGEYDLGFWLIGLGPSSYNIFQRLYGQANGWEVTAGELSYNEPGDNGNWMGGPRTIELDGEQVEPGELAYQLNRATGDEEVALMEQLAKVTNQELPVIQMWDYINTRFFNESRFTGFPDEDSDALRLSPGVWMAEGWIKAK